MKKLVAKLIGTMVLVFVACGVATVSGCVFPDVRFLLQL